MPNLARVRESDRALLPLSVGPIPSVPSMDGFNGHGPWSLWGLCVGAETVQTDWVYGESPVAEIAQHLMRKWLGVRS